eukprot:jgi/Phyca11/10051/fgenesh1_pm.PHYCAscaffold_44_\
MMASRRTFDRSPAPFSDAVIGNVLTRASGPGYQSASPQQPIQYTPPSTVTLPPLRNLSPLTTSSTKPAQTFQLRPMTIRLQRDAAPVPPVRSFHRPSSFGPVDSPARAVSAAACREQCRTNQARYRQKQREYVSKLESTVSELRDEIPMLEVQRRRLRYDSQQRVWDVVVEYFQLFRHGVGDAGDQGSASSNDVLRASEAQQQLMFLRSTMAPDVEFGTVSGVELLMDHWRRLSEYHENLQLQLTHMDKVSESIVKASATLSVTITKTTLESVFPRLMRSENVEDLSLAVKLLGHTLEYPCSVLFVWDEETSLVVRMETEVDMTTPLLGLLGNLKDVSRVLTGAVMTPSGLMDEFMA